MSLEEKLNQVKGSVKEGFGKLTGDTKTEAPKGPALPETGDDASMAAMALGGILAVAGLGLAGKRKKED